MPDYELPWDGTPLDGPVIAFDTETSMVEDDDTRRVPQIALATASVAGRDVVLEPGQIFDFFRRHPGREFVAHNQAFDFWVVHEYLGGDCRWLWDDVEAGRWHCTMLLDQLVNIAAGKPSYRRGLDLVAAEYGGGDVDKGSPYRKRFAELIGRESEWSDPSKVDPGFFAYAAGDTRGTLPAYLNLKRRAEALSRASLGRFAEGLWTKFGVLTEQVQVKAAISLAQASRTGLAVDYQEAQKVAARLESEIEADLTRLAKDHPSVFKWNNRLGSARRVQRVKGTSAPQVNTWELGQLLASRYEVHQKAALVAAGKADERPLDAPTTSRGVSTAMKLWAELMPQDEFVQTYGGLSKKVKLQQFVTKMRTRREVVAKTRRGAPVLAGAGLFDSCEEREAIAARPEFISSLLVRYETIVETGRTSCFVPKAADSAGFQLQQAPRAPWFRAMFVAPLDHLLLIVDYSYIELVTLAAVCLRRYKKSRLADVLRAGHDPHAYTAALMSGLATADVPIVETMRRWADFAAKDKAGAKTYRQAAKPLNFGIPGCLGDLAIQAQAKVNYGVDLPLAKWTEFRGTLIGGVYPELAKYLTDDTLRTLAANLHCGLAELTAALGFDADHPQPPWFGIQLRKVLSGNPYTKEGKPYKQGTVDRIWETLERFAGDGTEQWKQDVRARDGSNALSAQLLSMKNITLTGRIRAGVDFPQFCNGSFQGLAADGGKLAMWDVVRDRELRREGLRYCAFIHDECIFAAPRDRAEVMKDRVSEIMVRQMRVAIQEDIPVKVAVEVSERWEKP